MPKLAGTFQSESSKGTGSGATRQNNVQLIKWFAIYLDDTKILLRVLDGNELPTKVSRLISNKDFLSRFTPDIDLYLKSILPLLVGLRNKLNSNVENMNLSNRETALFKALQIEKEYLPNLSDQQRYEITLKILSDLPDADQFSSLYKNRLNQESINYRKSGNYQEAINLYNGMVHDTPDDDHIYFNIARVYYDQKDYMSCKKYLCLALEYEPSFKEAKQFLRHIDKSNLLSIQEKRKDLRYKFHKPQKIILTIDKNKIPAYIIDLSVNGAKISIDIKNNTSIAKGQKIKIKGKSSLISPLLNDVYASIIWMDTNIYGSLFESSLDSKSKYFKRIIGYSSIV